jgi:hypothetical protein
VGRQVTGYGFQSGGTQRWSMQQIFDQVTDEGERTTARLIV